MTFEEFAARNPKGAEQAQKETAWFQGHVKCCYNCSHWDRFFISTENECTLHSGNSVWDAFCDDWCSELEDNLLDYQKISWHDKRRKNK